MKDQKVIISKDEDRINKLIDNGWRVTNVVAQHLVPLKGGANFNYALIEEGQFCFILEKE